MTNENTPTPEAKPSVPFFKRKWVWAVGIIIVIAAISSAGKGGTKAAIDPAPVSSSSSDTQSEESSAPEESSMPEESTVAEEPSETIGQSNALAAAENYISTMPFSKKGLIEQLVFEKYSKADATYAAENISVDWNEQAAMAAKNYLDLMPMSKGALYDQLVFEGYTPSQANYGVRAAGL